MTAAEQTRLYTQYRGKVLTYIRSRIYNRDDAEDLCEDVFEKAFRAADTYDASKSAPGTWLYAITRNAVYDYCRRVRPVGELTEDLSDEDRTEDSVLNAELLDTLAAALERLPAELVDVIVLRYYDQLPLTQVAEKLGVSYGVVKIRHQKALTWLRSAMDVSV